jgi:hypothetical protein
MLYRVMSEFVSRLHGHLRSRELLHCHVPERPDTRLATTTTPKVSDVILSPLEMVSDHTYTEGQHPLLRQAIDVLPEMANKLKQSRATLAGDWGLLTLGAYSDPLRG